MALGKALGVTPLEAEIAVNKFWVNNYVTLVDAIEERIGFEDGRKLAYDAYHKAIYDASLKAWEKMKGTNPDAKAYAEWLFTDMPQGCELEIIEMTPENVKIKFTKCPYAPLFRAIGKEKTGVLFCSVDKDIAKDFNRITGANIGLKRTKLQMNGCDQCDPHYYVKK